MKWCPHATLECHENCAWYDEAYDRCIFQSILIELMNISDSLKKKTKK